MIERHLLVLWCGVPDDEVGVIGDLGREPPLEAEVADHDGVPHGWELVQQGGEDVAAVDALAVELVAVHPDQHGRLDLREPVDQSFDAEIRCAARPHRTDAGCGQQRDDGGGDVR